MIRTFVSDLWARLLTRRCLQWLALTPPQLVQEQLGLDDATMNQLTTFKTKEFVVGPSH